MSTRPEKRYQLTFVEMTEEQYKALPYELPNVWLSLPEGSLPSMPYFLTACRMLLASHNSDLSDAAKENK